MWVGGGVGGIQTIITFIGKIIRQVIEAERFQLSASTLRGFKILHLWDSFCIDDSGRRYRLAHAEMLHEHLLL
ncbi:MAG: hypothetical protein IPI17_15995 [Nitrosomonas sp.]|nr:hypothetical protein [Nitrosomonas sp.]